MRNKILKYYLWESLRVSQSHCLVYHFALVTSLPPSCLSLHVQFWRIPPLPLVQLFLFLLSDVRGLHYLHHWNSSLSMWDIWENRAPGTCVLHTLHSCKRYLHAVGEPCKWIFCHCFCHCFWWKCSWLNQMSEVDGCCIWVSLLKDFPSIKSLINDFLKAKVVVVVWFGDFISKMCTFEIHTFMR